MQSEPHSRGLYDAMRTTAATPVSRSYTVVDEQIDILRKEIRDLWDRVRDLEMELEGWRYSHKLSSTTLQDLITLRSREEIILKGAKDSMRPIWLMPTEVWKSIFKALASVELQDYLKYNNEMPFRSTALTLSRVCKSWHQLVAIESSVWQFATIHPSECWSQNKYDLLTHTIVKSGPTISFVCNLSQTLSWMYTGYYQSGTYYRSSLGHPIHPATPNESTALNGKSYSLLLDMVDDQSIFMQKLQQLPFRNPCSLTLSSRNPLRHNYLFSYLQASNTIKSLTIINENPQLIPSVNLSALMPQLTSHLSSENVPTKLSSLRIPGPHPRGTIPSARWWIQPTRAE